MKNLITWIDVHGLRPDIAAILLAVVMITGYGGFGQSLGSALLAWSGVNIIIDGFVASTPTYKRFTMRSEQSVMLSLILTLMGIGGLIVVAVTIPLGVLPNWQYGSLLGMGIGLTGRLAMIGSTSFHLKLNNTQ